MKILTFIFFALICFEFNQNNCKDALNEDYIDNTDLIAIVYFDEDSQQSKETAFAKTEKVFKGGIDGDFFIKGFDFRYGTEYLVYAQMDSPGRYSVPSCSRTTPLDSARIDLDFLDKNIKCIDTTLVKDGACLRSSNLICGCDGKLYWNSCEANKKGVAVYSIGKCD